MVILPAIGKLTGINSAKADIVRKKININHISGENDNEGIKYMKRTIAKLTIIPIYSLNFKDNLKFSS
jgi:hypothetical protein